MKIRNCRADHMRNPLGFEMTDPVFSYIAESDLGKSQKWAQIRVALDPKMEEIIADSGKKELNSLSTRLGLSLKPRTRYYWDATVESDAGDQAVSEVSWFETAKMDEPWLAQWITTAEDKKDRLPVFEKNFSLNADCGQIERARLYISGLGLYQASINGKAVTEEKLTPYCNNYNEWVQYQTYDIGELLEEENRIAVTCGEGWYSGRFGFDSEPGAAGHYGSGVMMIAELHITYADGKEQVIVSDDSWTVRRSQILFSSIYDGEHVDARLTAGPAENVCCTSPKGKLTARMSLPVYAQEELPAKELILTPVGEQVFDLGQNMAGGFRLHVDIPEGQKVYIQVGEVLQQGNFYRDNLRSALAEYSWISDGKPHDIEPVFTYYGYRYAKVQGIDNLKKEDFTGLAYYSDITPAGSMKTGKAKLNQLLSNISWGQKGNFIDVPTDCPQRDERMGWTADTQVFVPTAEFLTDSMAFYRKFLYDLRTEQRATKGGVPHVIPSFGLTNSCSVWGDCATIIPWTLYLYSGDISILDESLDSMIDWVNYIGMVDGDTHHWREIFHFGDWLALDSIGQAVDAYKGGTDDGYIADIYYMQSAEIVAESARLLGKTEIAEKYQAMADRIRDDIRKEFFTPTGRCAIMTQTGYLLALRHHLTDDRAKTLDMLLNDLRQRGNKLSTGFVGTPFLNQELSKHDHDNLAYKLLHNEEYPGWLYEINLGATTVWERWNSMLPDGSVSSTGMNSFNHYAYGSIGEWMWRTMAGINPLEEKPGFKEVLLRPVPDLETGSLEAVYDSVSGTYRVSWTFLDKEMVKLCIDVPFDCRAALVLPYRTDGEQRLQLESGHFELTYRFGKEEKKKEIPGWYDIPV